MWSPFSFDGLDVDDTQLPNITTDMGFDEGIVKADDKADDDGDLDLFRSYQLTKEFAKCDDDPSCKEDSMPDPDEDDDFDDECDDFDKSEKLEEGSYADIAESVLEDEDDDLIADSLDDMPDDDDPEIDADVDGVEEIEQDIMDDEEDDLIDIAMDADSDEDVDYCDEE